MEHIIKLFFCTKPKVDSYTKYETICYFPEENQTLTYKRNVSLFSGQN